MNITIKIDNELARQARHRAIDDGVSLSGWVARLIEHELAGQVVPPPPSLAEALRDPNAGERDVAFERLEDWTRETDFA